MLNKLLQLLSLSCRHGRTSQPFAAAPEDLRASREREWDDVVTTSHYVVCFDCGRKFAYDWEHMRVVR